MTRRCKKCGEPILFGNWCEEHGPGGSDTSKMNPEKIDKKDSKGE